MEKKLLIAILGNRNSGKSETWKSLFNDPNIRTAQKSERDLNLEEIYTKVFLINGSPQERDKNVEDIIQVGYNPNIVLCSIQYKRSALDTLNFFEEKGYFIYLHWLNPGFSDSGEYQDELGIIPEILKMNSIIGKRDGKISASNRVKEIRDFLKDWSKRNALI
ncbi:hypothetical protein [Lysinibacillus capsici]|uniref:hypothetical protein n=1 Tax=Lysinibacillus capsici TaxID=2115968 RepID=UPI002481778C|nr:hypothetical protein [Lysinibacillus capsici]